MIEVEVPPLDFSQTTGGLPLWPGASSASVVSAPDALGWTYHHHPDLACWKGRLYVAWNASERDEDTWPSRELYSTSLDGKHWSAPQELFPQGASTPLRMYFYHSPEGRLFAVAGKRLSHEPTREATKGPLVAREVFADHSLGPLFDGTELQAERLFLAQQDYGRLLPEPGVFATSKALSFFQRGDGAWVAVGKKRWTALSHDAGATWTEPVCPPTLITNMGKVWGQRLPDGRYLLAYNPHEHHRFPLALVTSEDGEHFGEMYCAHEALPPRRFEGLHKSIGASYARGLSPWSSDGSRSESCAWLVYSIHKEEIVVTCLPL